MNLDQWEFHEEPWWDGEYRAIKFAAEKAGVRHICAISRVALNDYFQTEDTKEAAFVNYHEHSNMVHSLAVKLIQEGAPNDQNVFFITSDICQNNWP